MTATFVSLFSGVGGLDLGFERAGWRCVTQIEVDQYCRGILERHWPDVPRFGDVRDVSGSALPACDAIIGGFPCQPVSVAGRQQGTSDPRWLWPEFARLVDEIRPRIVFVENVPGLRTRGGAEVIADLAAMGYDCEWGELSAAALGAPHLRKRFYLIAHTDGSDLWEQPRRRSGESRAESAVAGDDDTQRALSDERRWQGRAWVVGSSGWLEPKDSDWGEAQPSLRGADNGIPHRLDRLRGLGNAVVPQWAETLGHYALECFHARRLDHP